MKARDLESVFACIVFGLIAFGGIITVMIKLCIIHISSKSYTHLLLTIGSIIPTYYFLKYLFTKDTLFEGYDDRDLSLRESITYIVICSRYIASIISCFVANIYLFVCIIHTTFFASPAWLITYMISIGLCSVWICIVLNEGIIDIVKKIIKEFKE